jgi:hypothetical protein
MTVEVFFMVAQHHTKVEPQLYLRHFTLPTSYFRLRLRQAANYFTQVWPLKSL